MPSVVAWKKYSWEGEDGEAHYAPVMDDLVGRVFTKVYAEVSDPDGPDLLVMENEVERFIFCHDQDCCESVYIESVVGDMSDLIGVSILVAEEVTNTESNPEGFFQEYPEDSFTWTFYKFATIKGYVDVRWYGSSNGYYSESVDLHYKKLKQVY